MNNVLWSVGLVLCLGAVDVSTFGSILRVGKTQASCPHASYSTITAAVKAAAPGDVVEICPALYPEQVVIKKPLTLRGLTIGQVNRTLIQPTSIQPVEGLSVEAVITVMNTEQVQIENVAVDASKNTVSGCTPGLAAIHYFNASGTVENDAIFGAQLKDPQSCAEIAPGNGFGVLIDSTESGPFDVSVKYSSIHDYTKDGVSATNQGVTANVEGNSISGVGPAGGIPLQFAVFVVNGAVGVIRGNVITEGLCGTLSVADCVNARSEGVTLRAVGNETIVEHNVITNVQSGIFVNDADHARISENIITNVQQLDGIDLQGVSNSLLNGNIIANATPTEGCGIAEAPGPGSAGGVESNNVISETRVNDAFCGVAYVPTSRVVSGMYFNTLFTQFRSDVGPPSPPPGE